MHTSTTSTTSITVAVLVLVVAQLLVSSFTSSFVSAAFGSDLKPDDATRTAQFGPVRRIPVDPTECTSIIVMLHGLGDSGDGWLETMAQYQYPQRSTTCILLPTARRMYVKVAKQTVNAWFDVSEARFRDVKQETDVEEVKASAEYVLSLVRDQMKKFDVPWKRVVLAGFSQGGSLALYVGLTAPETPGGIVSIGGFLSAQSHLLGLGLMKLLRKDVPILMIHGAADTVVPIGHAYHARDSLKKVGVKNIDFKEDATLNHGLNDAMYEEFTKFLDKASKWGQDDDDDTDM